VFIFALALALQHTAPAPAQISVTAPTIASAPSSSIQIPRVEDASVVIDGILDEPVWTRAARLTGFRQYEPVDGRPAEEETEVLVWYAPDAIHFGIIARDRQPEYIRASIADRDNIDGDDHVIIYLDTFNDRRRAFFFATNPLGVQQDGVRSEGASSAGRTFGGSTDKSPDYWYQSKGRLTGEGYTVEIRIPFKSLRYPAGDAPQRWGLQVERKVQRTGYLDTWTETRRASASFLAQAGTIEGLHDLHRGIVFEAQPFFTASANGAPNPQSGGFRREAVEPEVGLNLRLGFTSLSLDATINPDFSQVEADAGQVTINERFALFFDEKRPFFLEGIELFATPSQLVHTRQIASPRVGGKLTGKVGGISVAHLTALDELPTGDDALVNVTRLRRDFGTSSLAGVTYTDRTLLDGEYANRVLAADLRYVFGGMYYAEAQLGNAWTMDRTDAGEAATRGAPIWKVEVDRTGRRFGFNYRLNGIDDDFHTDAGFVRRSGIIEGNVFNRLSFYGAPGALFERLTLFLTPSRLWRYQDFGRGDAIEGSESLNLSLLLRGGWEIEARPGHQFYRLDPASYSGYEVGDNGTWQPYTPLDRVAGYSLGFEVGTPAFRSFNAGLSLRRGGTPIFDEGAEGTLSSIGGSLSLRPDASIRIALSTTLQRIARVRDDSEFARTIIPRAQLEYQPARALFFRAIGEWRAERRAALMDARTGQPLRIGGESMPARQTDALRIDLLTSYTPTPGTVAFLGYGTSLGYGTDTGTTPETRAAFAFHRLTRASDGFFIKLAYQFRR
jgi:hypothetical protein